MHIYIFIYIDILYNVYFRIKGKISRPVLEVQIQGLPITRHTFGNRNDENIYFLDLCCVVGSRPKPQILHFVH